MPKSSFYSARLAKKTPANPASLSKKPRNAWTCKCRYNSPMKHPAHYGILHQDEALIAINKPPGLAVLPGRGRSESLIDLLSKDPALHGLKPMLVHRIDADTSGLI